MTKVRVRRKTDATPLLQAPRHTHHHTVLHYSLVRRSSGVATTQHPDDASTISPGKAQFQLVENDENMTFIINVALSEVINFITLSNNVII